MALREAPNGEDFQAAPPPHLRSEESQSLYRLQQRSTTHILERIALGEKAIRADFDTAVKAMRAGVSLELESRFGPKSVRPPPLPPARAESPSSMDLAEQAKAVASVKVAELVKKTDGPNIDVPPGDVEKVIEDVVDEMLRKRAEAERVKAELARLASLDAAAEQRKKDRRKVMLACVVAFFAAIATGAGAWTWGKTQGHLEEARSHTSAPR